MVDIPKKLKIGGHWYKVKFPYRYQERSDWSGHCDNARKRIYIGNDDGNGNLRAESAIIVTLIHEIYHAIDNLTGYRIFSGPEGEARCEALSESTFQFLVDNGYLVLEEEGEEDGR